MKPQPAHPCTAALASILSAKPQPAHPCTAALASILSAKRLRVPTLLLMALAATSCGRAPVTTRPALPALERPTLVLQAKPERLRIPRAALVERGGIPGVFVLDARTAKAGAHPETANGPDLMAGRTSTASRDPVSARGPRTRVPDVPPITPPIGEAANGPSLARGPRLGPIGEARFRMVRPGHVEGDRLIILAGLHGNETLVLGDLRSVRDGSPITPVKSGK